MAKRHFLDRCRQISYRSARFGFLSVIFSTIISLVFLSGASFAEEIDMGKNSASKDVKIQLEVKETADVPETSGGEEPDIKAGNYGFLTILGNKEDPDSFSIITPIIIFLVSSIALYFILDGLKKYSWKTGRFSKVFVYLSFTPASSQKFAKIKNPALLIAILFGFTTALPALLSFSFPSIALESQTLSEEEAEEADYWRTYTFEKNVNPFDIALELTVDSKGTTIDDQTVPIDQGMLFSAGFYIETKTNNPTGYKISLNTEELENILSENGDKIPSIEEPIAYSDFTTLDSSAFGFIIGKKSEFAENDKIIVTDETAIIPVTAVNKILENYSVDNLVFGLLAKTSKDTVPGLYSIPIELTAETNSVNSLFDTYNLTFNGINEPVSAIGYTKYGRTFTINPKTIPEKTGYTFLGWAESESNAPKYVYNESKKTYAPDKITLTDNTKTLYPIFKEIEKEPEEPQNPQETPTYTVNFVTDTTYSYLTEENCDSENQCTSLTENDCAQEQCIVYKDGTNTINYKKLANFNSLSLEDVPVNGQEIDSVTIETPEYIIPKEKLPALPGFTFLGFSETKDAKVPTYTYDQTTETFAPKITFNQDEKVKTLYAVYELTAIKYSLNINSRGNLPETCTVSSISPYTYPTTHSLTLSANPHFKIPTTYLQSAEIECNSKTYTLSSWEIPDPANANKPLFEFDANLDTFSILRDPEDIKSYEEGNILTINLSAKWIEKEEDLDQDTGFLSLQDITSLLKSSTDNNPGSEENLEEPEKLDEEAEQEKEAMRNAALARAAARRVKDETPETSPAVTGLITDLAAISDSVENTLNSITPTSNDTQAPSSNTNNTPTNSNTSLTDPLGAIENNARIEETNEKNSLVTTICAVVIIVSGLGIAIITFAPLISKNRHKKPVHKF